MYQITKIRWDNCPWCMTMEPLFKELAEANTRDDVEFKSIHVDDLDEAQLEAWGIRSIPTFIILNELIFEGKITGVIQPKEFKEWIDSFINE